MAYVNYFRKMTTEQLFNIENSVGGTFKSITPVQSNKILVSCFPKIVGLIEHEDKSISVYEYRDLLISSYDVESLTINTFNNYYSTDNKLIKKSTHEKTYEASQDELDTLTESFREYMRTIFPEYERKALEHDLYKLYRYIKHLESLLTQSNNTLKNSETLMVELQKAKTKLEQVKTKLANLTPAEMQ